MSDPQLTHQLSSEAEDPTPSGLSASSSTDIWARWLSVASIAIALLLGFKSELIEWIVRPQITFDLQETPAVFTRFGHLRLGIFMTVRTGASRNVEIGGVEMELRSTDGINVIKMRAESRQSLLGTQMIMLPFKGLVVRNTQPLAEFVIFEDSISDGELGQIAGLEHKLNRSLYDKQYPEADSEKNSENVSRTEMAMSSNTGASSKSKVDKSGYLTYTYTAPTYILRADTALIQQANKLFESNFKLKPGSYMVTTSVFGKANDTLATRKYALTVLEGQSEAIRESWSRFVGTRYTKEIPPVQDSSLRLRPLDS